jgi:hypothetical protein
MKDRARFERGLVTAIALHSVVVGAFLLFATEWSVRLAGWDGASPRFFARQAGVFHLVIAAAYLLEYARYRGVSILLTAKGTAVVFLLCMSVADRGPLVLPLSALADGAMGLAVVLTRSREGAHGAAPLT